MNPEALAKDALSRVGLQLRAFSPLPGGSTARVWRVDADAGSCVLRVAGRGGDSFATDRAIRAALIRAGAAVAEPVAGGGGEGGTPAWALDAFVSGRHPPRGALPSRICADLADTLRALHGRPARGFGRARADAGAFVGRKADPTTGVADRFDDALPSASSLRSHRIASVAPEATPQIAGALASIRRRLASGEAVLLHSDLHERQLLVRNGRLAALIDFGEAMVGDRRWDFGSFRYFQGAGASRALIDAYEPDPRRNAGLARDATLFSIAIALHHATRSRLAGKGRRLKFAGAHVRAALAEIDGRPFAG